MRRGWATGRNGAALVEGCALQVTVYMQEFDLQYYHGIVYFIVTFVRRWFGEMLLFMTWE